MPEQVHVCLRMPPTYRVAHAVGRWQGHAALRMHRAYLGRPRNFPGLHCWARGYGVRTVGLDEAVIRQDIRNPEEHEKRAEHLALGDGAPRREGKPPMERVQTVPQLPPGALPGCGARLLGVCTPPVIIVT